MPLSKGNSGRGRAGCERTFGDWKCQPCLDQYWRYVLKQSHWDERNSNYNTFCLWKRFLYLERLIKIPLARTKCFIHEFSDSPPTYEEVMRSKEIILKQKLNIMRNQLESLEDYAQLGLQKSSCAPRPTSVWYIRGGPKIKHIGCESDFKNSGDAIMKHCFIERPISS